MRILLTMIIVLGVILAGCASEAPAPVEEPEIADESDDMIPEEPEVEVEGPEEVEETKPAASATVQMLGVDGFDPLEIRVKEGATVAFVNTLEKDDTLVFRKEGVVAMENSDIVKPGMTYERTFEAGNYQFWSVGYGPVGATITVE